MATPTTRSRVLLVLTCWAILANIPGQCKPIHDNQENVDAIDPLMDDAFYQEFPEVVDPSSKSKYLVHEEDMTFIKSAKNGTRTKRNAVFYQEDLWPGARIPYEIASTFDGYEKRVIYRAMAHWEEHTCVRFYPKRATDRYSIYINNAQANDCSSFVGRTFYRFRRQQGLSLGAGCVDFSTVVHELGHTIGLYHEHNRADRDDHITVYPERHFYPSQVQKQSRSNTLGKGYDYASIMHYSRFRDAIISKIGAPFGRAEELSPLDIAKVNLLYGCGGCNNRPPISTIVPSLGLPDNTKCGTVIRTSTSGSFSFPRYPAHQLNQKCNFVIAAPEGYGIEYHVRLQGSDLDSSTDCVNSYIAFYEGASVEPHRIYNYRPRPRFCFRREFIYTFLLPTNVTTISYQSGKTQPQPILVDYFIDDQDECRTARGCQRCVNTAGSYECTCRPGFYLSRPAKTCYDINECANSNGGCQHTCTNSAGSYRCSCSSGYFLQADGKSCSTRRPSATPWTILPGTLDTKTCPVTFSVPNQPPMVTTPKPTTVPPTTPPPPTTTPPPPPTTTPPPPPTTTIAPAPTQDVQTVTSSTMNSYDTQFSTPGWPEPYPLNRNFEWRLECPSGVEFIDIKFEEDFKVAGKMPECLKDQVYVYSNGIVEGGPFCHITAPQPMLSLNARNTKVTFSSGTERGLTRTGFAVRFQCRPAPTSAPPPTTTMAQTTAKPTTPLTTPRPTTLPPTTAKPTTPPTTATPTAPPTTATPTAPPTTAVATTAVPAATGPCGPEVITASSRNEYSSIFSTPGWPDQAYPLNVNCEWRLHCPSMTDLIDIQFEGSFRIAGKMPLCPKARVNVYSMGFKIAGPLCHLTAPEPIRSLNAGSTRVTFYSGSVRGSTRTGFAIRFQCRPTSSPTSSLATVLPTTDSPAIPPEPTTLQPTAPPTTPNPTVPPTTLPPTTAKPTAPPTTPKPPAPPTTPKPTAPPTTLPPTTTAKPTAPPTTPKPTAPPTTTQHPTTARPTTPKPTTIKATTQSITTPSAGACGGDVTATSRNTYSSFLSTPGWPSAPYPLNMNCEWVLRCPPGSFHIDVRFEESFKIAGKMPSCPKDQVFIETTRTTLGPFCHLTRPDPITFLDASNTKVTFRTGSGRGVTRTGFALYFQCR